MKALRIVLSVAALLIAGLTDVVGEHLLNLPVWAGSVLLAVGGILSTLGVAPIAIPATLARVFGLLSGIVAALLGAHAGGQLGAPEAHVALLHIIGVVGILLGWIGRVPTPSKAPPPGPPAAAVA